MSNNKRITQMWDLALLDASKARFVELHTESSITQDIQ